MAQKLRILIAGDLFMKPRAFQEVLERRLADQDYDLMFRSIEYPYPIEQFNLVDYPLPERNNGVWDDAIYKAGDGPDFSTAEVNEYYGRVNDLVGKIQDEDILIVHSAPVPRAALDSATNLKLIACCRGGPTNINIAAATERGIPVINAPGRNAWAVAEFTIGLLLSHIRQINRASMDLTEGIWRIGVYHEGRVGPELHERTVGLIGVGNVGRRLARILNGFEVQLLGHDPYVGDEVFEPLHIRRTPLDQLLQSADFVILAARLTPETRGMIGRRELALMKPTAYLVNTARGKLVDYAALRQVLEEGRIAGAVLDVYPVEPPMREDILFHLPNVSATPHIAGGSADVLRNATDILAEDISRFLRGEPLLHCINPEVYTP